MTKERCVPLSAAPPSLRAESGWRHRSSALGPTVCAVPILLSGAQPPSRLAEYPMSEYPEYPMCEYPEYPMRE